jgi:hypothetical protein
LADPEKVPEPPTTLRKTLDREKAEPLNWPLLPMTARETEVLPSVSNRELLATFLTSLPLLQANAMR